MTTLRVFILMLVFLSAPRASLAAADGGSSTDGILAALFMQWSDELQKGFGDQVEHATLTGQTSHLMTSPVWQSSWDAVNDDWNTAIRQQLHASGSAEKAKLGFSFRFDIDNPFAVAWAKERSASLVTQVTDETKAGLRTVIGQAFASRQPPRDLAKLIKPMIGLTEVSARAVLRQSLAQLEAGKTQAQVQRYAQQYSGRLLQARALTIARTETMAAQNAGTQASWLTAKAQGLIPPGMVRRWIIARGSDRTCPICTDFGAPENRETGLTDPFVSSEHGELMQPPAHPNCRCTVGLVSSVVARPIDPGAPAPTTSKPSSGTPAEPPAPPDSGSGGNGGGGDDEFEPVGTPVSAMLELQPKLLPEVTDTLAIVGRVHGLGDLQVADFAKASVRMMKAKKYKGEYNEEDNELGISKYDDEKRLTTGHEVGHLVDRRFFAPRLHGFASQNASPILDRVMGAIDKSEPIEHLKALGAKSTVRVRLKPKGSVILDVDQGHVEYLLRGRERFARAYAQYIALRGRDANLSAEDRKSVV